MSRTENVELTVVCLLEDGGRVLLQNRKKEDWHGWALPGGHVEPGESFVDAAIREMQQDRMEISSEFIDMAAHLVQMKSALLLPRSPEAERMKAELTGRLIEYSACKER